MASFTKIPQGVSGWSAATAAFGLAAIVIAIGGHSNDRAPRSIDTVAAEQAIAAIETGAKVFKAGHYESSARIFQSVIDRLPGGESAAAAGAVLGLGGPAEYSRLLSSLYANLGLSFLRSRQYESAIRALERAVALSPRSRQPRVSLGLALLHTKRFGEAARELERALAMGTGDAKLHLDLARAVFGAGDLQRARWALHQATRLVRNGASVSEWGTAIEAEKLFAEIALKDRKADQAEQILRGILEGIPGEVQSRYRLIQLLERQERWDEAAEQRQRFESDSKLLGAIQAALVADTDGVAALTWVADSYRQLGLLHLAEVHYRQLLAKEPENTKAFVALRNLEIRRTRVSTNSAASAFHF